MALIGPAVDLRYEYEHLGDDTNVLKEIVGGRHQFSSKLKSAKKPLIIVGSEVLERPDGAAILSTIQTLALNTASENKEWKVLNILHKVASQVNKSKCFFLSFDSNIFYFR